MNRGLSLLSRFLSSTGFLGVFVGAIVLARWGMLDLLAEKRQLVPVIVALSLCPFNQIDSDALHLRS